MYFHFTCNFITLINALRLCKESTKGGSESVLEIILALPPHCKYTYIPVNPCWCVCVSKLSNCMVWSAYQQLALHCFFMLSVHDTSPSCSLQCVKNVKVLGLTSWRLQSRLLFTQLLCLTWHQVCPAPASTCNQKWWRAVTAKGVPSPHCPISTSSQSTRTPALECCIQQSGVKCQLCLKLLIQVAKRKGILWDRSPFCFVFAQCLLQCTPVSQLSLLDS